MLTERLLLPLALKVVMFRPPGQLERQNSWSKYFDGTDKESYNKQTCDPQLSELKDVPVVGTSVAERKRLLFGLDGEKFDDNTQSLAKSTTRKDDLSMTGSSIEERKRKLFGVEDRTPVEKLDDSDKETESVPVIGSSLKEIKQKLFGGEVQTLDEKMQDMDDSLVPLKKVFDFMSHVSEIETNLHEVVDLPLLLNDMSDVSLDQVSDFELINLSQSNRSTVLQLALEMERQDSWSSLFNDEDKTEAHRPVTGASNGQDETCVTKEDLHVMCPAVTIEHSRDNTENTAVDNDTHEDTLLILTPSVINSKQCDAVQGETFNPAEAIANTMNEIAATRSEMQTLKTYVDKNSDSIESMLQQKQTEKLTVSAESDIQAIKKTVDKNATAIASIIEQEQKQSQAQQAVKAEGITDNPTIQAILNGLLSLQNVVVDLKTEIVSLKTTIDKMADDQESSGKKYNASIADLKSQLLLAAPVVNAKVSHPTEVSTKDERTAVTPRSHDEVTLPGVNLATTENDKALDIRTNNAVVPKVVDRYDDMITCPARMCISIENNNIISTIHQVNDADAKLSKYDDSYPRCLPLKHNESETTTTVESNHELNFSSITKAISNVAIGAAQLQVMRLENPSHKLSITEIDEDDQQSGIDDIVMTPAMYKNITKGTVECDLSRMGNKLCSQKHLVPYKKHTKPVTSQQSKEEESALRSFAAAYVNFVILSSQVQYHNEEDDRLRTLASNKDKSVVTSNIQSSPVKLSAKADLTPIACKLSEDRLPNEKTDQARCKLTNGVETLLASEHDKKTTDDYSNAILLTKGEDIKEELITVKKDIAKHSPGNINIGSGDELQSISKAIANVAISGAQLQLIRMDRENQAINEHITEIMDVTEQQPNIDNIILKPYMFKTLLPGATRNFSSPTFTHEISLRTRSLVPYKRQSHPIVSNKSKKEDEALRLFAATYVKFITSSSQIRFYKEESNKLKIKDSGKPKSLVQTNGGQHITQPMVNVSANLSFEKQPSNEKTRIGLGLEAELSAISKAITNTAIFGAQLQMMKMESDSPAKITVINTTDIDDQLTDIDDIMMKPAIYKNILKNRSVGKVAPLSIVPYKKQTQPTDTLKMKENKSALRSFAASYVNFITASSQVRFYEEESAKLKSNVAFGKSSNQGMKSDKMQQIKPSLGLTTQQSFVVSELPEHGIKGNSFTPNMYKQIINYQMFQTAKTTSSKKAVENEIRKDVQNAVINPDSGPSQEISQLIEIGELKTGIVTNYPSKALDSANKDKLHHKFQQNERKDSNEKMLHDINKVKVDKVIAETQLQTLKVDKSPKDEQQLKSMVSTYIKFITTSSQLQFYEEEINKVNGKDSSSDNLENPDLKQNAPNNPTTKSELPSMGDMSIETLTNQETDQSLISFENMDDYDWTRDVLQAASDSKKKEKDLLTMETEMACMDNMFFKPSMYQHSDLTNKITTAAVENKLSDISSENPEETADKMDEYDWTDEVLKASSDNKDNRNVEQDWTEEVLAEKIPENLESLDEFLGSAINNSKNGKSVSDQSHTEDKRLEPTRPSKQIFKPKTGIVTKYQLDSAEERTRHILQRNERKDSNEKMRHDITKIKVDKVIAETQLQTLKVDKSPKDEQQLKSMVSTYIKFITTSSQLQFYEEEINKVNGKASPCSSDNLENPDLKQNAVNNPATMKLEVPSMGDMSIETLTNQAIDQSLISFEKIEETGDNMDWTHDVLQAASDSRKKEKDLLTMETEMACMDNMFFKTSMYQHSDLTNKITTAAVENKLSDVSSENPEETADKMDEYDWTDEVLKASSDSKDNRNVEQDWIEVLAEKMEANLESSDDSLVLAKKSSDESHPQNKSLEPTESDEFEWVTEVMQTALATAQSDQMLMSLEPTQKYDFSDESYDADESASDSSEGMMEICMSKEMDERDWVDEILDVSQTDYDYSCPNEILEPITEESSESDGPGSNVDKSICSKKMLKANTDKKDEFDWINEVLSSTVLATRQSDVDIMKHTMDGMHQSEYNDRTMKSRSKENSEIELCDNRDERRQKHVSYVNFLKRVLSKSSGSSNESIFLSAPSSQEFVNGEDAKNLTSKLSIENDEWKYELARTPSDWQTYAELYEFIEPSVLKTAGPLSETDLNDICDKLENNETLDCENVISSKLLIKRLKKSGA
uniref:Uncharacterized protein LOC102802491 n=1 Tax=Saccoglossus kowalevskii TaxID=10224 RepID=A0ABM0LVM1_SACKO|nr:PREDICTED: uncharacterized protein LOC102802491 [Saccoglossus kowalevskii]